MARLDMDGVDVGQKPLRPLDSVTEFCQGQKRIRSEVATASHWHICVMSTKSMLVRDRSMRPFDSIAHRVIAYTQNPQEVSAPSDGWGALYHTWPVRSALCKGCSRRCSPKLRTLQ